MKKIIVGLMVIFLSACTLGTANTPKEIVSEFLDKYKNQNEDILTQLRETIEEDITDTDYRDRYETLMTNQYKNLEYEITEEIIEDDNAVVEAEVTVYDYASAIRNANEYLNSNPDEFTTDIDTTTDDDTTDDSTTTQDDDDTSTTTTTDYDEDKFMDYKLSQMENVTDKVTYTIEFTLTKVNGEWQLDELSDSDIEKLHGIYVS